MGQSNISAYPHGMVGYKTPNIDRIANEGMNFRTHVKDELRGISGQDEYADGMVEHDMHIGKFLDKLDELGIADNTWPDAAATPFRG